MRTPRGARGPVSWRRLILPVVAAALLAACSVESPPRSSALWRVVSGCLDPGESGYCARCAWPVEGSCGARRDCRGSTQIWAETQDYVAIRDIKMCECPPGFVHGLALPKARVTGVEDPRRLAGIWAFAWETARLRIPDEREIALVLNPPRLRTQDQLHVHLVRLAPGARTRIAAGAVAPAATLDQAWQAAAAAAADANLDEYGVLVMRDGAGRGFLVLADPASPETGFTIGTCR